MDGINKCTVSASKREIICIILLGFVFYKSFNGYAYTRIVKIQNIIDFPYSCLCFRFMDNLQTEVLEIEFLSYSNGMNTISEEDFAHILLRYTNVENTSSYLENMRCRIPEEKVIV